MSGSEVLAADLASPKGCLTATLGIEALGFTPRELHPPPRKTRHKTPFLPPPPPPPPPPSAAAGERVGSRAVAFLGGG